jgi:pyrroline-5-carboxylate reductase
MSLKFVNAQGLVLVGCGKMGSAMLAGWLQSGVASTSVYITDPNPSDWLRAQDGINLNSEIPRDPAVIVIAVKPQMMGAALPAIASSAGPDTIIMSIAAGTPISVFEEIFGSQASIVRAMPNTPAAIGRGITAIVGNKNTTTEQLDLADQLLTAIGQTVRIEKESQMDAVTGVSGSGPAYVFHLIETLAKAGEAQGLPQDLAMKLAKATVAGAGALAEQADEDPSQLRVNVTSPGGTTAAALNVLMDTSTGFPSLLERAVAAATDRSRELGR